MRPELAALAIHDLKNALSGLEARLDALRHDPQPGPARDAHRLCADMHQRFVTFLTLYGADGEMKVHCDDESPRDFLEGLANRADLPNGASPVEVRVGTCDKAPPFWYFDFRLVRMAMEAALHNARRFARSAIVLDAHQQEGCLVFSIDDDGPGLSATNDPGGAASTGLGTALCEAVALAHGSAERHSKVRLFDRDQGGARFELWLA